MSKYLAIGVCDAQTVFAHKLAVFALSDWGSFALLTSSLHDIWARKNSSSLENRLNYSPSDAFETLPFPAVTGSDLPRLGEFYADARTKWCREHEIGLTSFYNAFHDPDQRTNEFDALRRFLVDIDTALLAAYGWQDLDPGHGFHDVASLPANDRLRFTMSHAARLECLRRLGALNRERWREEQAHAQSLAAAVAAAAPAGARRRRRGPRLSLISTTPDMFDTPRT